MTTMKTDKRESTESAEARAETTKAPVPPDLIQELIEAARVMKSHNAMQVNDVERVFKALDAIDAHKAP